MTTTRMYRDGTVVLEDLRIADTDPHLIEEGCVAGMDLRATKAQSFAVIGVQVGLWSAVIPNSRWAACSNAGTLRRLG